MYLHKNSFGSGQLYQIDDLKGKIYFYCTACMSIWSEALSWANAHPDRIAKSYAFADNIVVLSCQVTDLATYNDLYAVKRFIKLRDFYPKGNNRYQVFVGGCLSYRFDIELPEGCKRLEHVRKDYQWINDRTLVTWQKPFWVSEFEETKHELADGNLFRNYYPLRIGVGCGRNCAYCTIREVRGKPYSLVTDLLVPEFKNFDNIVLISDSPFAAQIKEWCNISQKYCKPISIRNLEPQVAMSTVDVLVEHAKSGLLKNLHVPIQSSSASILADMRRDVDKTLEYIELAKHLKNYGVVLSTNVIINYKGFPNAATPKVFDYISWNPYWDGKWDLETAKKRFTEYLQ